MAVVTLMVGSGDALDDTPKYKVGDDFIYRIMPNQKHRYLNPNSFLLVKNISLQELYLSVFALRDMQRKLGRICKDISKIEGKRKQRPEYDMLNGRFSFLEAGEACLARGRRLAEIRTPKHLLDLIRHVNGSNLEFPAGVAFSQGVKNFVFSSDNGSFLAGPVTISTNGHKLLPIFDSYIYRNHHLKYVVKGLEVTFDYVGDQSAVFHRVLCMGGDTGKSNILVQSCFEDLEAANLVVNGVRSMIDNYVFSLGLKIIHHRTLPLEVHGS